MRPVALLLLLLTVPSPSSADERFTGFDSFVSQYREAPADSRKELVQSFIAWQQARGGFPLIEADGSVVFFFQGSGQEKDVRVIGDFKQRTFSVAWDEAGEALSRASESGEVFFKRLEFEQDARLEYRFIVDGAQKPDPLNPHTLDNGVIGMVSALEMPAYKEAPEVAVREDVPKGTLTMLAEAWATPKVTVYLPANYEASKRYPVVYTADGSAWINYLKLPTVLDNLIADGAIEPVIAVMIDPAADRSSWYQFNPEYLAYLEKVVAYVDGHYPTRPRAEDRLHLGSSAGGRCSLYVGLERPGLFRKLAMLSPSLAGAPSYYEPYFSRRKRPDPKLRIWMSAGSYERYIHEDTRLMERYFKETGLKPRVVYTHRGHSLGSWRSLSVDVLKFFFPAERH
ncbi:alpha/beta hydrolase-fold protein [Archangium sp.]|uniref:alpha/beta hydrolase-fold protein n=1 Tax=Archangium sp. TaxID=1872627 RepID=UPI00389A60F2